MDSIPRLTDAVVSWQDERLSGIPVPENDLSQTFASPQAVLATDKWKIHLISISGESVPILSFYRWCYRPEQLLLTWKKRLWRALWSPSLFLPHKAGNDLESYDCPAEELTNSASKGKSSNTPVMIECLIRIISQLRFAVFHVNPASLAEKPLRFFVDLK
jgi:hypothetical protein